MHLATPSTLSTAVNFGGFFKSKFSAGLAATDKLRTRIRAQLVEMFDVYATQDATLQHRGMGRCFVDRIAGRVLNAMNASSDGDAVLTSVVDNVVVTVSGLVPKTFASLLTSLLWELDKSHAVTLAAGALSPLDRLRNELIAVTAAAAASGGSGADSRGGDNSAALPPDVLDSLPFLNACLQETERLCPPILGAMRGVDVTTQLCGFNVPANHKVWVCAHTANRDAAAFESPLAFRPERWLDDDADEDDDATDDDAATTCPHAKPHAKSTHLAFGTGPRACPGASLSLRILCLVTSRLVASYEWRVADVRTQDVHMRYLPVRRPKDGLKCVFSKR
jgi:cytochrome P450